MEINNPSYLFIFIPIFFTIFFLAKPCYRKWIILIASVILYILFQKLNFFLVLGLVGANYCVLSIIKNKSTNDGKIKIIFLTILIFDLIFLLFFKIITTTNWIHSTINGFYPNIIFFQKISFPIGLSFIVFQLLSTLIDGFRSKNKAAGSFWDYLIYIFMFPKIVMGPITRFNDIYPQISNLQINWENILSGSKRFIIGLAKKVIIADQLAILVNAGFGLPKPGFTTSIAWLLIIAFLIQIYYDFSGYIDMVIGLAKIFGIEIQENFNSPYLALNITDFWRRWHMTLTSWFREYLFFPLERLRRKPKFKFLRQETNTIIIFLLTGLWHGPTINFIVWGLLQGIIISFENSRYGRWIKGLPLICQRSYFFTMLILSWVFFRSESIGFALRFIKRLIIVDQQVALLPFSYTRPIPIINNSVLLVITIGIIGLFPLSKIWANVLEKTLLAKYFFTPVIAILKNLIFIIIFILSIAIMASQNFVPSIYAKF